METTNEIWRDIPNYEGYYQVSNLGRVKSLKRNVTYPNNKLKTVGGIILKQAYKGGTYLIVSLCKNNIKKTFKVHKLVAMAFLGHKPCGRKEVVDHIDNNQLNNRLDNLQLTTVRHNSSKDKKGGTSKYIGVHWDKSTDRWRSSITVNGKVKFIGRFNTEIEASKAYQDKLNSIMGGYNG